MKLSDFPTLADAKKYSVKTYRKIGGNEARQFFALAGVMNNIEAAQSSVTVAKDATFSIDTTIGQLAKAVVDTIRFGQFATDPNTQDGILNRKASSMLVAEGVYSQEVEDGFFARAETQVFPYENHTEYDFKKATGACPVKEVSPINGWLKIATQADCEAHRPQVHASIQGILQRVAGFPSVSKQGEYLVQVPKGYSTLYVDDAYGVL